MLEDGKEYSCSSKQVTSNHCDTTFLPGEVVTRIGDSREKNLYGFVQSSNCDERTVRVKWIMILETEEFSVEESTGEISIFEIEKDSTYDINKIVKPLPEEDKLGQIIKHSLDVSKNITWVKIFML